MITFICNAGGNADVGRHFFGEMGIKHSEQCA